MTKPHSPETTEPLNPEADSTKPRKSRVRVLMERLLNKPYEQAERELRIGFAAVMNHNGDDAEDLDPFSTASMNRRIENIRNQARSNDIKKLAQQIMVTHPHESVHQAISRATYIYDTTNAYEVKPI